MPNGYTRPRSVHILKPEQNSQQFDDNSFTELLIEWNFSILIEISQKGLIHITSSLAHCYKGKQSHYQNPWWTNLKQICNTRP